METIVLALVSPFKSRPYAQHSHFQSLEERLYVVAFFCVRLIRSFERQWATRKCVDNGLQLLCPERKKKGTNDTHTKKNDSPVKGIMEH